MASEVVAIFAGPLSEFDINLSINNATRSTIKQIGLSGQTAERFPIIWDDMGAFSGPAVLNGLDGIDTQIATARFSGFGPGETVKFNGIDPDFAGDISSGVKVGDLAGVKILVIFSDGSIASATFNFANDGTMRAVATKD